MRSAQQIFADSFESEQFAAESQDSEHVLYSAIPELARFPKTASLSQTKRLYTDLAGQWVRPSSQKREGLVLTRLSLDSPLDVAQLLDYIFTQTQFNLSLLIFVPLFRSNAFHFSILVFLIIRFLIRHETFLLQIQLIKRRWRSHLYCSFDFVMILPFLQQVKRKKGNTK